MLCYVMLCRRGSARRTKQWAIRRYMASCPRLGQPYAPRLHSSEPAECAAHTTFAGATLGALRRFELVQLEGSIRWLDTGRRKTASAAAWNGSWSLQHASSYWSAPTPRERWRNCSVELIGDHFALHSWYAGNFQHAVADNLPMIAWMRLQMAARPRSKLLLARHGPLLSTLISAVDPQFGSARIVWVRPRRIACLQGTLRVVRPSSGPSWVHAFRRPAHMLALHGWIAQIHPPLAQRRTVVFASRSGRSASHGRLMDPGHERQILGRLRATTGPRHLELVVFNGEAGGAVMPLAEQLTLFRAASAVVAPQGGALTNLVWTAGEKGDMPSLRVLEFVCGRRSVAVGPAGCPYTPSFWSLLSMLPWVEYHHLAFTANSTERSSWVDLDELDAALRSVFT